MKLNIGTIRVNLTLEPPICSRFGFRLWQEGQDCAGFRRGDDLL